MIALITKMIIIVTITRITIRIVIIMLIKTTIAIKPTIVMDMKLIVIM